MHQSAPPPTPEDGAAGRIVAKQPAKQQFAGTILVLEGVVMVFATFVVYALSANYPQAMPIGHIPTPWVWGAGLGLTVWFFAVSRTLRWRGGYALGWLSQAVLAATSVAVPLMAVVAVVFIGMWIVSLRLGARIDRERAEYDAAHPATAPRGAASP